MKNIFKHLAVTVGIGMVCLSLLIGLLTLTPVKAEQSRQQRNSVGGWDTPEGSIMPLANGRIRLPDGSICSPDGEGGWYCPSGHYTPQAGGGSTKANRSGFSAIPNDQGGYDTPKGPVSRDGYGGYVKPAGVYILPRSATGESIVED
jgi:hypothetical protein